MFSHWLAGLRDLHWCVLRKLPQLIDLSSYGDVYDMSAEEQNKKWKKDTDELYNYGASIVHNLNRALYYTRQLTGSDKDILFPDPSIFCTYMATAICVGCFGKNNQALIVL